jgi:hypothetical protein
MLEINISAMVLRLVEVKQYGKRMSGIWFVSLAGSLLLH